MIIETYKDAAGEHRWRCKAANGEILAASSEGYKNRGDMSRAIGMLRSGFPFAKMVAVDDA